MDAVAEALRQFVESLDSMGAVKIFGSLGMTATLIAVGRWFIDRRRWGHYKAEVHRWLELLDESPRFAEDLGDEDWKAECERMLVDSRFSPTEVVQLHSLAVTVAKAIAANRLLK